MQFKTILVSIAATALMVGQGVVAQDEQVRAVDAPSSAESLESRAIDDSETIETREPKYSSIRGPHNFLQGIPRIPRRSLETIETREPKRPMYSSFSRPHNRLQGYPKRSLTKRKVYCMAMGKSCSRPSPVGKGGALASRKQRG